ncbi:hypothetical protein KKF91_12415 [Myxococcota bacterium]|nr:hypothetical protein [Myxococcota bacterium]MBU1431336.1 hypothetical protein [Myxococcota bacterium]MBU1900272.1 hypothetical protein [Myxococcota bacterium]
MTRTLQLWLALLLLSSMALCFVPLFHLLAFEFSFAMGLPLAFFGAWAGVQLGRARSPLRAWLLSAPLILFAGILVLLPISLNALRVRNCNFGEGLWAFALIPLLSAFVAAAFGALFARRGGLWAFTGLWWATLSLSLYRLWTQAPVDAFHPFLGYFPGPIYDEVIALGDRVIAARLEDLGFAAAAVALADALYARRLGLGRRRVVLPLLLGASLALGGYFFARRHDVHRDAAYIQARLGGQTITPHLRVYHPKGWSEAKRRRMGWELEFAYEELTSFFGQHPQAPFDVYLYPSRTLKKRLMGAGRTRVAKPWQRAMHIHAPQIGDSVTLHEMAHVFSAEIANPPHHLSLYHGLPNMALIEGLAVAATWESDRVDAHHWSAALHALGKAPKLKGLLAPQGFWAKSHAKAYTLSGSFVRHLHERLGAARVAAIYRAGCFDSEGAQGLDSLLADWQARLDALPLDPQLLQHARDRYDRPAVFRKVCAHEIAALWRRYEGLKGEAALAVLDEILGHVKRDAQARLARIGHLVGLNRLEEARAAATRIAADPKAGAVARQRAALWLIDLRALEGDLEGAGLSYADQLEAQFERAAMRALAVKGAASLHPQGPAVFDLMLRPKPKAATRAALDALVEAAPRWGVAWYLRGRSRGGADLDGGVVDLSMALELGLPHESLRFEAQRLIALRFFALEEYASAEATFAALLDDPDLKAGERFSLSRWRRRARFFEAQARVDRRAPQS